MWPRWAFPFSIALGTALIGVAVGLIVAAAWRGTGMFLLTLAGTLLAGTIGWVYMTVGQRYRLRRGGFDGKMLIAELLSAGALFVIFRTDEQLAATIGCAFIGVGMLANARMIRIARADRPAGSGPG
ncbi:hypothetical protein SAMN04488561_5600 [Jiangella alba]|uniref:ATP synthase protein I n=2 Tax=Jiangella alba TaxID=561176 RepID=A0A1H5PV68_9ACTN|nr:hypothetical protein SAMN04488561_5600 [Jiangella alba]